MKIFKNHFALALISMSIIVFSACNSNSNKSNNTQSKSSNGSSSIQEETREEAQIAGTYSGTDNVSMESTIIHRSGGSLIIQASVGDGTPDYGNWTGTADNLSLYHKDAFGNDELIGNAKVTDEGNGFSYEDIDKEIEKLSLEIQKHDNESYSNHIKQLETLQAKFASNKISSFNQKFLEQYV